MENFVAFDFARELDALSHHTIERTALHAEVATWLAEGDARSFLLTGQTGTGKSAFAAQLVRTLPNVVAYHFCVAGRRPTLTPHRCLISIAAQLLATIEPYAESLVNTVKPHQLRVDSRVEIGKMTGGVAAGVVIERLVFDGPIDEFETLLQTPLARLASPAEQCIVVLDGLDESATLGEPNIASLLEYVQDLPPWIRFVLTSQPDRRVLRHVDRAHTHVHEISANENDADLRTYIEARGFTSPAFVEAAVRKAAGNFQYAKVVLDGIKTGSAADGEIPDLPADLHAVYDRLLRRISPDAWSGAVFRIASTLAAAYEPLTEEQIARFSSIAVDEVRLHLGMFGQFLQTYTDPRAPAYAIFHQSLRAYFFDRATNRDFWISPGEAHARIAALYVALEGNAWSACDPYGLHHLPSHLAVANDVRRLETVLCDLQFIDARARTQLLWSMPSEYLLAREAGVAASDRFLEYEHLVRVRAAQFERCPTAVLQEALNQPEGSALEADARRILERRSIPAFEWINKPRLRDACAVTISEHDEEVRNVIACAFGADGTIVGVDDRSALHFWELGCGKRLRSVPLDCPFPKKVAFSPDGRFVAVAVSNTRTKFVRIFETATCDLVQTLANKSDFTWATRGWQLLFAGTFDNFSVLDLDDPSTPRIRALVIECGAKAFALAPDGARIAVTREEGCLSIYDVASGVERGQLSGHRNEVQVVMWSPDGMQIATGSGRQYLGQAPGSEDFTVRLWDAASGAERAVLRGHRAPVFVVCWSPDSKLVLSADAVGALRLWDATTGKLRRVYGGHAQMVNAVAWSTDGASFVSSGADRTVKKWSIGTFDGGEEAEPLAASRGFVLAPDSRTVALVHGSMIELRTLDDGSRLAVLQGHTDRINECLWSPDGTLIATTSDDGTARIWDVALRRCARVVEPPHPTEEVTHFDHLFHPGMRLVWKGVRSLRWLPDGHAFVTSSSEGLVLLWPSDETQPPLPLTSHRSPVANVVISPDGRYVATTGSAFPGGIDPTVVITDLRAPERPIITKGNPVGNTFFAWTPDQRRILIEAPGLKCFFVQYAQHVWEHDSFMLSGGVLPNPTGELVAATPRCAEQFPKSLVILDVARGSPIAMIDHPEGLITACWTADGKQLWVGSIDNAVTLHDARSGSTLATFWTRRPPVQIDIGDDGRLILVRDAGGDIYVLRARNLAFGLPVVTPAVLYHVMTGVYDDSPSVVCCGCAARSPVDAVAVAPTFHCPQCSTPMQLSDCIADSRAQTILLGVTTVQSAPQ